MKAYLYPQHLTKRFGENFPHLFPSSFRLQFLPHFGQHSANSFAMFRLQPPPKAFEETVESRDFAESSSFEKLQKAAVLGAFRGVREPYAYPPKGSAAVRRFLQLREALPKAEREPAVRLRA